MIARAIASDAPARERLLRVLAFAIFIIFFQAFMVAPLIPRLSVIFGASPQEVGLVVSAYLVPYGAATLVYGLLGDQFGLWRIMAGSLTAFTVPTATARTVKGRVLTGLGASGVVPLALVLVGRFFPYERRGRSLGWLFGPVIGQLADRRGRARRLPIGLALGAFPAVELALAAAALRLFRAEVPTPVGPSA